jgi:hypothetical protein
MCLSLVVTWWENIRQLPISEHVWEHTRCLLFAYTVPTRGSSFIFGFWPCKLRGLKFCRKGNGIIPFLIKMQCWRRSTNAIYFPYVGSRSKRSKQGSGSSRSKWAWHNFFIISFCFSAKQLLSFNYLYFLHSGNFMPYRITLIKSFNLNPQAAKYAAPVAK